MCRRIGQSNVCSCSNLPLLHTLESCMNSLYHRASHPLQALKVRESATLLKTSCHATSPVIVVFLTRKVHTSSTVAFFSLYFTLVYLCKPAYFSSCAREVQPAPAAGNKPSYLQRICSSVEMCSPSPIAFTTRSPSALRHSQTRPFKQACPRKDGLGAHTEFFCFAPCSRLPLLC
jgi:hypothetical protein